jgi:hypothetical protein
MSEREKDMGRLAAREQDKPEDADNEGQENQESKENQESQESTEDTTQPADGGGKGTNPSSEPDASEQSMNVKDREATLFAYLPESLDNDVDLACQSVNLTYQSESGEKLGRNRYLYPIVLMVGADNAVDLSYEQIQDLVERVDEVEDAV